MAVTDTLARLHLTPKGVALGEARVAEDLTPQQLQLVAQALQSIGFELVADKQSQLVANIKQTIIDLVRNKDNALATASFSTVLAERMGQDFALLSRIFAAAEGRTIEKYFLLQRIEYVKELIEYGELSIKEIAWRTGFSSVAHLSRQFKQLTGMTPTAYRQCGLLNRKALDQI